MAGSLEKSTLGLRPAVFLDRDGVLNELVWRESGWRAPKALSELELRPGVLAGISLLKQAGYFLVAVTNQPDVSRGWLTRQEVENVNRELQGRLGLDEVRVCWHDAQADCPCRKPLPGMLLDSANAHGIRLSASALVGDRKSDMEAGRAAGCETYLIRSQATAQDPAPFPMGLVSHLVTSLEDAAQILLMRRHTLDASS